ncbi:PPIC-type PPIASE domain-containing protein [Microbulbifer donghaiensis]|uniref:PPIC-type PPIASE domain-containing protein n=1 Tax=Microbulbifer donghaiensis TaxID=494016 RepID=A0A1M5CXU3_9GAMM|nr:peptidylprolyl isomerase [Microbulbifer donghaiensis]SHF59550.1 PPIC-type PPIASE domain-containing protein [Microbulbifer donghaiensis]
MSNKLLGDPLVHFMLIGGLLFGINALFSEENAARDEIVVSQSQIDHLAAVFERGWQRPPSEGELDGLVENFIREEVLYREAQKLGLDQNDTVIRRRLRMKMEFLARDLVNAVEPGDTVLQTYFGEHRESYRQPARLTFRQLYFDSGARASASDDARSALIQLNNGAEADDFGDSNLLRAEYTEESAGRVDRLFGEGFAAQLGELPSGRWAGPLQSAYGLHLVYLEAYEPQRPAAFAPVRAQVLRDWQLEEQKNILRRQYEAYRATYDVRIEGELRDGTGQVAQQ